MQNSAQDQYYEDNEEEEVEPIMDDIDEQQVVGRSSDQSLRKSQLISESIEKEEKQNDFSYARQGDNFSLPNDVINLGPNLNMHVSAIGHLRRRKKQQAKRVEERGESSVVCHEHQDYDLEDEGV